MARIVYITNGLISPLNASFELSRQLTEAGHEIIYLSHADISASVAANGYRFVRITENAEIMDELIRAQATIKPVRSLSDLIALIRLGRGAKKKSLGSRQFEDQLEELRPDLLIIDIEMHTAIISAAQLDIPMVTPILWFSILRNLSLPPMNTDLLPPQTIGQRLRVRWEWYKKFFAWIFLRPLRELLPRRLKRRLGPISFGTTQAADLKAVAKAKGYNLRRETSCFHWLKPHVYRHIKVICYNALEMDFPHQPPAQIEYVGPLILENRPETEITQTASHRWQEFRDDSQRENRSIVYCSLGTFWATDTSFLEKVIAVFKKKREWALVIGLGGKLSADELTSIPENVLAMSYAPQLEILQDADVAITHGGIASINECIFYEVPMLVCSTGHVDQPGCAARLEYHQLGIRLDIATTTSEQLETHLSQLLNSNSIRGNVRQMKVVFDRYREQGAAVSYIEKLLSAR